MKIFYEYGTSMQSLFAHSSFFKPSMDIRNRFHFLREIQYYFNTAIWNGNLRLLFLLLFRSEAREEYKKMLYIVFTNNDRDGFPE